jgi:hypothetical protein
MPISIPNLAIARQELSHVKETVEALDVFMARLERIFNSGGSVQPTAPAQTNGSTAPVPEKFIDRVTAILRESGQPMKPKAIERAYVQRNWPVPERGALYNNICGALGYLVSPRKRTLERVTAGYRILETR